MVGDIVHEACAHADAVSAPRLDQHGLAVSAPEEASPVDGEVRGDGGHTRASTSASPVARAARRRSTWSCAKTRYTLAVQV